MRKRILFAPDLHKRDIDPTTINGYTLASVAVQVELLKIIHDNEVTDFVSLGDWYDKGYRNTGPTLSDNQLDRNISEAVNGNAYMLMGNHHYLERDANPETYIIQPSELFPADKKIITPEKPIFKTVNKLVFGDVQISFFHFNKNNKDYIAPRDPNIKLHIGLYHDDCVLPTAVREQAGYFGAIQSSRLTEIYDNIDIAFMGHIHTKIGKYDIMLNDGKKVPIIIPGSLMITANAEHQKHKYVDMPMITIGDDGHTMLNFIRISTHMEMLKFYSEAKEKKIQKQKDRATIHEIVKESTLSTERPKSLYEYLLNKGYSSGVLNLVQNAEPGKLDPVTAYDYLNEEA